MKDIRITERAALTFPSDFFDLFSRTGLGDPNTDTAETVEACGSDCANFGKSFGVAEGLREIMLSLRIDF